ncbi:MAG TPA: metal ABC transporter permease [Oligoflexales bacterium]|nr:metal ABC transporter permease [Oligoflexales bacterium]
MGAVSLMALPFLECLILVGIHSYLGLHVIRRRVIFVDLALAQIAALGTTIAFLFGLNPHSTGAYIFSLSFTFIGAAVFSLTRVPNDRVPQEAVIGLSYALAASVGMLAVFGAPHGAEHIQNIAMGSLLWVTADDIIHALIAYSFVGVVHFIFRDKFIEISEDHDAAAKKGLKVRWWDFLFYMLFGLVITHSVQTAGVLLVFVFLVVPAIMGVMLTDKLWLQLAIGWGVGTLVSFVGLAVSYYGDLPSGPTVVSFYGLALVLVALVVYVVRAKNTLRALGHVGLGVAVTAALFVGFIGAGKYMATIPALASGPDDHQGHTSAMLSDGHALGHAHDAQGDEALTSEGLLEQLASLDLVEKKRVLRGVSDSQVINNAIGASNDVETKFALASRLLVLDHVLGAGRLLDLMSDDATPPIFRDDALHTLMDRYGSCDKSFDPWTSPTDEANQRALDAWRAKVQLAR